MLNFTPSVFHIKGLKLKNLKNAQITNCELFNCEIDGAELCNFEDTIFIGVKMKGKWYGNNHKQSSEKEIFENCEHLAEHDTSNFTNVLDFNKIKQKNCNNEMSKDIGKAGE